MRFAFSCSVVVATALAAACSSNATTGWAGDGAAPPSTTATTSGEVLATGPSASQHQPTLLGYCERGIECACGDIAGMTASECVDSVGAQLQGQQLPPELWQCLIAMDCASVCAAESEAQASCVAQVTQLYSNQQQAHHETMMNIIDNMGSTCPPGTNKRNGTCEPY